MTSVSVSNHDASHKHGDTMRCWVSVASLMKTGNEILFPSRQRTCELIRTGDYLSLLQRLYPELERWQVEFDHAKRILLPPYSSR